MNLFHRLGHFCARRRRLVLGAWLVALLAAIPLAPQLPGALSAGGFSTDDLEASRARHMLESELGLAPSAMVIVIQSETAARAGEPEFELAVARVLAGVPRAQYVDEVLTHHLSPRQVSEDGRTVYAIVTLDLPPDDSPAALAPVEAALGEAPGVRAFLAGGPAFYGDIQVLSEHDLQRSEFISLPLAALALLLVFGSVVAAGVPIVVGGGAVIVALAIIFLATHITPFSIFVLNLATLLGLGLGVDYALLLTSRFREELASGIHATREEAVAATVATAGRAVFFSGLTVLLGLIGLMLFDFMVLRSVGIAGAIVVGLAVTGALTLLPAVLGFLGPKVDALPVRRRSLRASGDGAWARLANRVMDRPMLFFVPTLAFLLLLGTPFLHARFNAPDATILPPGVPSREAYEVLVENFGEGEFAPLALAIRTSGPAIEPANVGALYDWSRRLAADPRVAHVEGLVDVDPRLGREQYQLLYGSPGGPADRFVADTLARTTNGDLTAFTLYTWYGPNREEALALVDELRDPSSELAPPAGMSVLVGGGAAEVGDVVRRIAADFPRSAAFIVLSTFLVLFVLLRSLVLPIKAILVNALSITAAFGALVWVFQDGNLSAPLGFVPLGFVETTLPVILFCVLFGLSMDYEVFLLSRMKEVYDQTGDNRQAVARGMERSGRIVTSAALIVVVVAGSFAFADIVLIKALGLGVAIAIALDASIVRALLVPSTMRLLGDRNWWLPDRVRRFISSRLHLPETAALGLVVVLLVAACSPEGRLLGVDPPARPSPPARSPAPTTAPDPRPISLPADEAPHNRLTEWWYYTGHLDAADGRRFGFEFVIFRAERGTFPVTWASHLALTDESSGRFIYEQRAEIGPQVDGDALAGADGGFDLAIAGGDPLSQMIGGTPAQLPPTMTAGEPWRMRGRLGSDALRATAAQAGFGLDLQLQSTRQQPLLHDRDGWVEFGRAGGSYYYSWPRMSATGTLSLDGQAMPVEGTAWFDHQWGDFIAVGGGGWDWFAVNLDDGTDLTISLVRDADGTYPLIYGTLVQPDGTAVHLPREALTLESIGSWTSPRTGIIWPAGWRIEIPAEQLVVQLEPTVADQELDTRPTTGVIYWEGSQHVTATRAGSPLGGRAYVELTGYTP
ncbi:MAG TPA: MMPL family transporter [Candidatus Limnocylindrales bacterium]|jgi:putative drug exporter of the RND superfamily|nr:MMPL family transporter [Candidatus Limnocylindrales bacterium]